MTCSDNILYNSTKEEVSSTLKKELTLFEKFMEAGFTIVEFNKVLRHPYHIVTPSPWPFFVSLSVFNFVVAFIGYMHNLVPYKIFFFFFTFLVLVWCVGNWFYDIIIEGTFEGKHTLKVQDGLRLGMILFIVSEIMFFVSFFWAYFHSSLAPSIFIGGVWPPAGIQPLNPLHLPLLNTIILLTSGASVTVVHYAMCYPGGSKWIKANYYLLVTVLLGVLFTLFQLYEYKHAPFSIIDNIYGSVFYMSTGFHGFHVLIGTIFLFVCFLRMINHHFMSDHHVGFEAAAWYWHFVDVVWLFLYLMVYWWGS